MYAGQIAEIIGRKAGIDAQGELLVETDLPLGKGMGSSTALVIATAKALLGSDCRNIALETEDEVNPGHSGMDFAVIWEGKPIRYEKGKSPTPVVLPKDLQSRITLIDTGVPNEQTPTLVAWVKSREAELKAQLEVIGTAADRILSGDDLHTVIREHHEAQVALGVVPSHTRTVIEEIESRSGAAKVIGAGGRSGGGGMVLRIL